MNLRTSILAVGAALAILAPAAGAHPTAARHVTATEPDACDIWATNCLSAPGTPVRSYGDYAGPEYTQGNGSIAKTSFSSNRPLKRTAGCHA